MDIRNFIRPLIAGLVAIGVVVLLIVVIIKLASGGGSTSTTSQINVGTYANTPATVTLLADDATKIDQDHRQVKIRVSQTQNEIDVIQGYQGNVIDSKVYPSNSAAFGAFLQSLRLVNFSKGNSSSALKDYRGYCPTGDRYVFTFNNGSKDLFTYWATSCGQGTFKGNTGSVLNLFKRQIPEQDFGPMTNSIMLGF